MTSSGAVRERYLQEAKEHYLSDEGFLDFVRDCKAAPDAEWEPHGIGAKNILTWVGIEDPENPGTYLYKNKMVLWPRGSFKSQVFTVGQCCWLIAKDPNIRIFIGSETGKQARRFLRNIMQIIESPWFEDHFGVHKDPKNWSYAQGFVSAQRTVFKKEPTCAAFGAGEVQTGAHWDFGLLDDPISQENTKTKESRDTTFTWIGEMLAQLDPGSRLLAIGTIHHFDDFWCRTLKNEEARKDWEISKHEWIDPDGVLFFPARLTRQYVENRRRNMDRRQFYAYYHNKPMSEDEQIFLPEYFRVIRDEEVPRNVWTYILTDFAFETLEYNDRTAFWVVALDSNRYAYVIDFWVGRQKPQVTVRKMCDMWNEWEQMEMKGIGIEDTVLTEVVTANLEEVRRETNIHPRIIKTPTSMGGSSRSDNKKVKLRVNALEPRFRTGKVYFSERVRSNQRMWKELFSEMTEWPFTSHDDIPDALAPLDQKDPRGSRFLFAHPPRHWIARKAPSVRPTLINGKFNPDLVLDPREMIRRDQQRVGDPLWQSNSANHGRPVQGDVFQRRVKAPSLLKQFWSKG